MFCNWFSYVFVINFLLLWPFFFTFILPIGRTIIWCSYQPWMNSQSKRKHWNRLYYFECEFRLKFYEVLKYIMRLIFFKLSSFLKRKFSHWNTLCSHSALQISVSTLENFIRGFLQLVFDKWPFCISFFIKAAQRFLSSSWNSIVFALSMLAKFSTSTVCPPLCSWPPQLRNLKVATILPAIGSRYNLVLWLRFFKLLFH